MSFSLGQLLLSRVRLKYTKSLHYYEFCNEHSWKVNFEVLVWISATNNSKSVVKMHELSQYVVKSISRVWVIKFMGKKLLKNRFWYRYEVIYEHLQHFFIESQKKCKQNALGIKINLNLDLKMIVLQDFFIISIPHTHWVLFEWFLTVL